MEIIVKFLEAMQLLLLAKVAMFLVLGLGLVIAGLVKHKRWLVAIGLVVALGQFAWPWLSNMIFEGQINSRRAYVSKLETAPIPLNYPRRLVLEGELRRNQPSWFIATGYVDEVDIVNDSSERSTSATRFVAAGPANECRDAALSLANPDPAAPESKSEVNSYKFLENCARAAGPADRDADAIILRLGRRTTLYDKENARHNGAPRAIQISFRINGKEVLAHYDEMPSLSMPKSATKLLPDGYEYPCSEFAEVQIVANLLDAARLPAQRAGLLKRAYPRHSQYDPCIVSITPVIDPEG